MFKLNANRSELTSAVVFLLKAVLCFFVSLSYAQPQALAADPTRPLAYTQTAGARATGGAEDTIHLSSILMSGDRKIAIINGQTLHEHQTIKSIGAVVKKIDADAVTLQQGNKTLRILLNKKEIRQ